MHSPLHPIAAKYAHEISCPSTLIMAKCTCTSRTLLWSLHLFGPGIASKFVYRSSLTKTVSHIMPCLSVIFSRNTVGTRIFIVWTSLYSNSSDYILSKAGLFSTKLTVLLPELTYFTRYNAMDQQYTKITINYFISCSHSHTINFCASASG